MRSCKIVGEPEKRIKRNGDSVMKDVMYLNYSKIQLANNSFRHEVDDWDQQQV